MTRGVFITGTDTGAGKSLVAAGLVRLLGHAGRKVVGLKPVASGAERTRGGLRNADALALAAESTISLPYELTNPWCFEPAIAPHLAARDAGAALTVDGLADWYRRATAGSEVAVVEGAGGWRVPLHPEGFLSDLPERLGLPVILVVGLRLGCLNHARLTMEAIVATGRCRLLGWIGTHVDPGYERAEDSLATLDRVLGRPPLAVVPWLDDPSPAAAMRWLDDPRLLQAVFPPR